MKEKGYGPNWIWRAACVLLCLTLFSVHMSSSLYARFVSGDSAQDSTRVASFEILQSGAMVQSIDLTLMPAEEQEYKIKLENKSETAMSYTITVKNLTGNLPVTLTWNDIAEGEDPTQPVDGTLDANDGTTEYILTIRWPEESSNSYLYYREIDQLMVIVDCSQVD